MESSCNTRWQHREKNDLKYLPLIWAALRRKPVEGVLTLLAVTVAFTLFGLMIGLHGMYQAVVDSARMDRVNIIARFPDGPPNGLPIGLQDQIARMDGVAAIGASKGWGTFYRDRANWCFLQGFTEGMREVYSELPLTRSQWDRLFAVQNGAYITRRAAARMQLKEGDAMPVYTESNGTRHVIDLTVLGVMKDTPQWDEHNVVVNYRLIDQQRPPAQQGVIWNFSVTARNPDRAIDLAKSIDGYFATSGTPTASAPEKIWVLRDVNSGLPITTITWTVALIGLFVVLLLVGNGIATSVQERSAELAVLHTLGFGHGRIRGLVLAEAVIPCLVGAIVGTTLAPLLAAVPRRLLPPGTGADPDSSVWIGALFAALVCAVLIAIAGAAIPLLRLAGGSVANALAGR